jgi:hypothetical protein
MFLQVRSSWGRCGVGGGDLGRWFD